MAASDLSIDRTKGPTFELIYWPGVPGRAEHIRLALEYAGADYIDTALTKNGLSSVWFQISEEQLGDSNNPPGYAPPMLKHGKLLINQTPNILAYLGPKLDLVPGFAKDPNNAFRVQELALTALDGLSNEVHNCHHPIQTSLYYEEQKSEAIRSSTAWVENRFPIFLGYFERVIKGKASGEGPWLFGGQPSYADLVLYQCLTGTEYQFPRATAAMRESGLFNRVFTLMGAVENIPKIKAYLSSGRRQKFGPGVYRYYEELDIVPTKMRSRTDDIRDMKAVYEDFKHLLPQ